MTSEQKKKALIIGGVILAFLLILWLLRKTNKYNPSATVTNGAGNAADTYYLTNNIPPINGMGLTQPNFGPITIGTGSGMGAGSCGGCDSTAYYGSADQLAASLGGLDNYQQAVEDALSAMQNSGYAPSGILAL